MWRDYHRDLKCSNSFTDRENRLAGGCDRVRRSRRSPSLLLPGAGSEGAGFLAHFSAFQGKLLLACSLWGHSRSILTAVSPPTDQADLNSRHLEFEIDYFYDTGRLIEAFLHGFITKRTHRQIIQNTCFSRNSPLSMNIYNVVIVRRTGYYNPPTVSQSHISSSHASPRLPRAHAVPDVYIAA